LVAGTNSLVMENTHVRLLFNSQIPNLAENTLSAQDTRAYFARSFGDEGEKKFNVFCVRSFIGNNQTYTPDLPVFNIDSKAGLRRRYEKVCPADCVQNRLKDHLH
jgi:hypothetical protein